MRHQADLRYYDEAGDIVREKGLVDFLKSLARYRQALLDEASDLMKSMPSGPITPSANTSSYLDEQIATFNQALGTENRSTITQLVMDAEKATSDYYRIALDSNRLVDGVRSLLEGQHQYMLDIRRKVERMQTVPMRRNNLFQ